MAGKNRYLIEITMSMYVSVEADTLEQANLMVPDALHDMGFDCGDYAIEKSEVVETVEDHEAKEQRYQQACNEYRDACDRHGFGSVEARALWAHVEHTMDEAGI